MHVKSFGTGTKPTAPNAVHMALGLTVAAVVVVVVVVLLVVAIVVVIGTWVVVVTFCDIDVPIKKNSIKVVRIVILTLNYMNIRTQYFFNFTMINTADLPF